MNEIYNFDKNQTTSKSLPIKKGLTYVFSSFLLFFLVIILYRFAFKPATLTVVGEGTVDFSPTNVSMLVTKIETNSDAVFAINEGETKTQLLINSAKAVVAGEEPEISKIFYQAQPVSGIGGMSYQVINAFSLKFNNVSKSSEMIKTLYQDGATSISSVSFSNTDKELVEQEVRELAIENATKKAKEIAKASGKRLGRVVTIIDDDKGAEGTVSKEVSGQTPQITLKKNVSIIFEIW